MTDTPGQRLGGFENYMNGVVANGSYEKNRDDKIMAMRTILLAQDILQKEQLTPKDVNLLFTLATSEEIKLFRNDDHDRKYIGKCELWLAEYGKLYTMNLRAREKYNSLWRQLDTGSKAERKANPEIAEKWAKSKERANILQETRIKEMTETIRQLMNSYFFIVRSSLSLQGNLIELMSTESKRVQYSGLPNTMPSVPQQRWPE